MIQCFILVFILLLSSCAGYQPLDYSNPLSRYNIKSISLAPVEMQGNLPYITQNMEQKMRDLLGEYKDLEIKGYGQKVDATIYTIIQTPQKYIDTLENGSYVIVTPEELPNTNQRPSFYVPASNLIQAKVYYYIVKDSNLGVQKIMSNKDLRDFIVQDQDKIVLFQKFTLSTSFSREVFTGEESAINSTINRGNLEKALDELADQGVHKFKYTVLHEF